MKQEQRWIDVYLGRYKWYRKIVGGYWYKHQFTQDALYLCVTFTGAWWARYAAVNRYSIIIKEENYNKTMTNNEIKATLYTAGIILGILALVCIIAAYPVAFFSIVVIAVILWGAYSFIRVMWTEIKLKLDNRDTERKL